MVTALGIDVRKAFTLVFAIGGVAAALAGVLSGVYFSDGRPERGTSLLIFAFIVVVIGGLGSIGGSARRRGARRARPAVRELLRVVRDRRHVGRAAARLVLLARPRGLAGERRAALSRASSPTARARRRLRRARVRAEDRRRHPEALRPADLDSPGTLQLLALCLVFGGLALTYDLLFGFTGLLSFGHALYVAVGVVHGEHRDHQVALGFWPAVLVHRGVGLVLPLVLGSVSLRVGGIAFAMVTLAFAQAGAVLVLKNPHGWTDGEEGFGVDYTKLPSAFVGDLQHEEPLLARARLPRGRLPRRALGGRVVAGPRLAGDPRERAARRGARAAAARVQADGLRARLVPRDAGGIVYLLLFNGSDAVVTRRTSR